MKTINKLVLAAGIGGLLLAGFGSCNRAGASNQQTSSANARSSGSGQNTGRESVRARTDNAAFGNGLFARIDTNKGDIVVRLEFQRTPLTVINFVALAEGKMDAARGRPYYDGLIFHRVISDFMIQGGCPQGNGMGGPGYRFPDEIVPDLRHDGPGVLSMANSGPGTNGSQFFITHVPTPWLDGNHTVFGRVVEGQNVVNAIAQGDSINRITIIRNGPHAEQFQADQEAFNRALNATAGMTPSQREAIIAQINRDYPNAQRSSSGIWYTVERQGTGIRPSAGQTAQVNYTGSFLSGEAFDSSDTRGRPFEFPVGAGRVIRGWDEMVLDMRVGERRVAVIPPELAYGERGSGPIPPNSFLVFSMELIGVR